MSNKDKSFFGHPGGLATLFATEMWERFSYYGMRALLTLFLTATLAKGGFGFDRDTAFTIYGIFTGLVYVTPLIGGVIADKVLGQRMTIYIGGLTMAIGQFMLAASAMSSGATELSAHREFWFYCGLGVLILGNGFFKPNISTMVGDLYDNSDPRKDGGFTIFYMGINLGAFISPFVAGFLGENISWEYGYLASGIGMLIGVVWFMARSEKTLGRIGMPPKSDGNTTHLNIKNWITIAIYTAAITFGVIGFLKGWSALSGAATIGIQYAVGILGGGYLVYSIVRGTTGGEQWGRVAVIFVLAFFNIFFWVGFEQAGTTFNLFAAYNTDRMIGSFTIPASWFQAINAIFIVCFAPLFSILWIKLGKLNPKTPFKFGWGMMLLAIGAAVMAIADSISTGGDTLMKVSPFWLILVYLVFTFGELCISPIGLSMVTKLSPPKLVSTLMGVWMFSFAAGNFGASQMEIISKKIELNLNKGNLSELLIKGNESATEAEHKVFDEAWNKQELSNILTTWAETNKMCSNIKDESLSKIGAAVDDTRKLIKDETLSSVEFHKTLMGFCDADKIIADLKKKELKVKEESPNADLHIEEISQYLAEAVPTMDKWISAQLQNSSGNITEAELMNLYNNQGELGAQLSNIIKTHQDDRLVLALKTPLQTSSVAAGLDAQWVDAQTEKITKELSNDWYSRVNVFWFIAIITAIASLFLFILGPWLSKMMKGIG
ncbi:MAG: peptide MFS transporter [Bacteroidales bacterium]